MKIKVIALSFLFAGVAAISAADKHDHDHGHGKPGPTGGRILHEVEPHAEFYVTDDKKVEIRFLDDDLKIIAPADQVVSVTTGERKKPTKLTFVKDGDKLISEQTLPEGQNNPTVVQIRKNADAKAVTIKFNLNLATHPGSNDKEYALGDHDHDHDHKEGDGHDHDHDHKDKKKKK